jgi:CheY-like chemotaxis protein
MGEYLKFVDDDSSPDQQPKDPWVILVVDDEEAVHEAGEFSLKDAVIAGRGLSFIRAYNGEETLKIILERSDIDLMFLDCVMKTETEGLELAYHVKVELKKRTPIIMMRTGFAGLGMDGGESLPEYLDDFLLKTAATKDALVSMLTKWLLEVVSEGQQAT